MNNFNRKSINHAYKHMILSSLTLHNFNQQFATV